MYSILGYPYWIGHSVCSRATAAAMGNSSRPVRGSASATGAATDAGIATLSDSLSDTAAELSVRSLYNADSVTAHRNQDSDQ
jgi:hypothetical protein